jgi:hypothetical protein
VHAGLAEVEVEDPGSIARTSSQLLAGVLVYKDRRINNVEVIRSHASSLGFGIHDLTA